MEDLVNSIILAIVQGITEWLPISSSGHLVLAQKILNYDASLLFDVALHFGTLMAVFVYFGKDIVDIIRDLCLFKFKSENGRTGVLLIIASIPAAIVGYIFQHLFERIFNSLLVIGFGFGITGLFLLIASLNFKKKKKELSFFDSFLIGIAQAISILPGISRSGATISSGILFGLNARAAARFSFLMSIPIIFGANILVIGNQRLPPNLIWATLVSFIVGLAIMHFLFKVVLTKKENLKWFGIYALLLALGIFSYLVS